MVAAATLSSVAYAWRKRDREHAMLAAFFGLTLAIDLIRLPLNSSPGRSAGWWVTNILYIMQFATVPALAALVLAKRPIWPVLVCCVIAVTAFVADPRSGVWLFKTCDVVAAIAAMVYAAQWLLRPDSRLSVAPAAVLLIVSFTAVGVFGHDALLRNATAWRIHSAAIACILLGIVVAQLRGVLTNGET